MLGPVGVTADYTTLRPQLQPLQYQLHGFRVIRASGAKKLVVQMPFSARMEPPIQRLANAPLFRARFSKPPTCVTNF